MARGFRDEDDECHPDWDPFASGEELGATRKRSAASTVRRGKDAGHDIPSIKVIRATGQAILCQGRGLSPNPFGVQDSDEEDWIPKSQLHARSEVGEVGDEGLLVITTWLAEKKGLV